MAAHDRNVGVGYNSISGNTSHPELGSAPQPTNDSNAKLIRGSMGHPGPPSALQSWLIVLGIDGSKGCIEQV